MEQPPLIPETSEPDPFPSLPTSDFRLAVTGHRPDKIITHRGIPVPTTQPPPTTNQRQWQLIYQRLVRYATLILKEFPIKPDLVYTGMALGWDQAIAAACYDLGWPYIACLPFEGQEQCWRTQDRHHYEWLLSRAAGVHVVCEGGFANWKYLQRDYYMVERATYLLAFWNGDHCGGTYRTVKHAESQKVSIGNCWQPWARVVYKTYHNPPHTLQSRMLTNEQSRPVS